ncbi:MAG: hypothetical protein SNG35_07565 [Rikenellaceae bacterium]
MNVKRFLVAAVTMIALAIGTVDAQPGGGCMGGGGGMGGPGGGMGGPGGGGPGGERQSMGAIDPIASSGLFMIDSGKAIKSLKIKDKEKLASVTELLSTFQTTYDNLTVEFSAEIASVNEVKDQMAAMMESGDRESMRSVMTSMRTNMEKIRPKAREMQKSLDDGMKALLSEDELKKWTKYYALVCEDNNYSTQERRGGRDGQEGEGGEGGQRGPGGQGGGYGR